MSDIEVIDLAQWQDVQSQLANLKSRIDQLTTNYGTTTTNDEDWNVSETRSHEFNLGNQRIKVGRLKFYFNDDTKSGKFFYDAISFTNAFSKSPIVTATVQQAGSPVPTGNPNIVITVYNVTASGFSVRATNAGSSALLSGYNYINWIAVGPN